MPESDRDSVLITTRLPERGGRRATSRQGFLGLGSEGVGKHLHTTLFAGHLLANFD